MHYALSIIIALDGKGNLLRQAILSDIHGNLAALEAVLADIESQNVNRIICLGDVVGYGPDPLACFESINRNCSFTLMGNHEQALKPGGGERFNDRARAAINWTRDAFNATDKGRELLDEIYKLETRQERGRMLFVHGSPNDPVDEYLMPGDANAETKMSLQWVIVKQVAFCGHTHLPGVFEEGSKVFLRPDGEMIKKNAYWLDPNTKAIVNVGSVGQPRDSNAAACYVIYQDDGRVIFRRVAYDIGKTLQRFAAVPELHPTLGARLRLGC